MTVEVAAGVSEVEVIVVGTMLDIVLDVDDVMGVKNIEVVVVGVGVLAEEMVVVELLALCRLSSGLSMSLLETKAGVVNKANTGVSMFVLAIIV